jgi:hypothetical protein
MATAAQTYAKEIRGGFGEFFANWPPEEPLALGDYGTIDSHVFRREGNLFRDFNISFEALLSSQSTTHYTHSSRNSVEIKLRARGDAALPTQGQLRAGIDLYFSAAHAVFFNAAGCSIESISSPARLKPSLLELVKACQWQYSWHAVMRIVRSQSCTAIISASSNSAISLDASEDITSIDLARADLRMSARNARNIASQLVTAGDAAPLFSCHRLNHTLLNSVQWRPTHLANSAQNNLLDPRKLRDAIRNGVMKAEDFSWVPVEWNAPAG